MRVLVADDDADVRQLAGAWLQHAGYDVHTVCEGRSALEQIERGDFDVVLSDIVMPQMHGTELLRHVRQRDLDLPVLLMTARPEVSTAIDAVTYGALRYLTKPLSEGALLEAVREAVRLRRVAVFRREALARLARSETPAPLDSERLLREALQDLRVAFQPIVRARDGSLFGHEALVRAGAVQPNLLFEAAQRMGTLRELSSKLRFRVAAALPRGRGLCAFVNLHPQELMDDELYAADAPLTAHAESVYLEITEHASVERIPDLRRRLRHLRQLGYRIALDDLGAGYSGLSSFTAVDPELMKIDLALVHGVEHDPLKRKVVRSLVRLGRELNILVLAEGVETAEQREVLIELGCDLLQGYYFGRPVTEAS